MPYRSILETIKWPTAPSVGGDPGAAFTAGRAQKARLEQNKIENKLRTEQFEFQKKVFEEKRAVAEAQKQEELRVKEEQEEEVKRTLLERSRIQEMSRVERAQASGLTGDALQGVYEKAESRYRQAAGKLGTVVDEFAFPDILSLEEPGKVTFPKSSDKPILASGRAIEGGLSQQRAQTQSQIATRAELSGTLNKRASPNDIEVASELDAMVPGEGLYNVEFARAHPLWNKARERVSELKTARAPRSSQDVTIYTGEIGKAQRGRSEGDIAATVTAFGALLAIENIAKEEHFGYVGRATTAGLNFLDKLSILPEKWNEDVQERQQLANEMDQFFLVYRKWATGVAGGEKEMESIKRAILNKDLGWQQVQGSIKQLKGKLSRAMRLHSNLLYRGIPDEEALVQMRRMLSTTTNLYNSNEYAKKRYEQMKKEGYTSDSEIYEIMKGEGYLLD